LTNFAPTAPPANSPVLEIPSPVRIVDWAQQFVGEVLHPGDLAVDLTAGRGRDTLFLARCVGAQGRVLAFDIQDDALRQTAARLAAAGAAAEPWPGPGPATAETTGVRLIRDSHAALERYLDGAPRGILANLGYLPGGDPQVTTSATSTVAALGRCFDLLSPGGRIAVALYVTHPGGAAEAEAVEALFQALPPVGWEVLRLQVANRPGSPYLLAAGKRPAD